MMTDMAENMKAAMDLIYLVSCAVNEEKPDADKCATMNLPEVYAVAERHSLRSAAAVALEQVMTLPRNFDDGKFKAIRRKSSVCFLLSSNKQRKRKNRRCRS